MMATSNEIAYIMIAIAAWRFSTSIFTNKTQGETLKTASSDTKFSSSFAHCVRRFLASGAKVNE